MPKRVATPPPSDDEPEYLTVYQPYPRDANFELDDDRKDFARWIACCIATPPFYAFFYKPKSRGMVILEIEKHYKGIDNLLGEHRWNEFLRNPTEEQKDRVSQIFYCLHKSNRETQKDGWKRIDVNDSWFKGWGPNNGIISNPYPKTHWCAPPKEDKTNKPLCRTLPVDRFPPPAKALAPVPGSSVWATARTANDPPQRAPPPGSASWVNAKNKDIPLPTAAPAVRGAVKKGKPASLSIPARGTTASGTVIQPNVVKNTSYPPNTPNAWVKKVAPSPKSANTTTPSSWASSSATTTRTVSTPASSVQSPAFPPGLSPIPCKSASSDSGPSKLSWWEDYEESYGEYHGGGESSASPDNDDGFQATDLAGLTISEEGGEFGDIVEPWEEGHAEGEMNWGGTRQADAQESLWDPEPAPAATSAQLLCRAHGVICTKGICEEYATQLREQRMAAWKLEEEMNGGKKGKGKGKKRKGKGRDLGSMDSGSCVSDMASTSGDWRHRSDDGYDGASAADDDVYSVVESNSGMRDGFGQASGSRRRAPSTVASSDGGWGNGVSWE